MKTIYALQHKDTGEFVFRTYKTRAGARIGQAQRNKHLGFKNPVERVSPYDNVELIVYTLPSGELVEGTYILVERAVDDEEFERLFE